MPPGAVGVGTGRPLTPIGMTPVCSSIVITLGSFKVATHPNRSPRCFVAAVANRAKRSTASVLCQPP